MVENRPNRERGIGRVLVGTLGLAAIVGTGAVAMATDSTAALLLLHGLALAGGGLAWVQARSARAAAQKAGADLDAIANRLLDLEGRFAQQATGSAGPTARPGVEEVTGEIGLLGNLVRDLAETVAAQDRDVCELKERLAPLAEEPHVPAHPEPSLLPSVRREPAARRAVESPARMPTTNLPPGVAEAGMAQADTGRMAATLGSADTAFSDADAGRIAAIVLAFDADRLELHLQPIVTLPDRKVRSYEVLTRLRLADDTLLLPAEFLPLIERLGHAAELDRRVAGRAIAIARHLPARGSDAMVNVNLSPRSLEESGFLRSLSHRLDACPDTLGRIVFELSQRCWRTLDAERAQTLAVLRDKGVPFALDRATDVRVDPLDLTACGVRFVKLSADLLLAEETTDLDIDPREVVGALRDVGIELVADCVEREESVPDLVGLQVPLAQGFAFAAPRPVRSDLFVAPGTSGTAADSEPPQTSAGAGGRLPFGPLADRAS